MDVASEKLQILIRKSEKLNVCPLKFIARADHCSFKLNFKKYFILLIGIILFGILSAVGVFHYSIINSSECLIEIPAAVSKAFRPPERCEFCRDVKEVNRVSNIKPINFEKNYAYSGRPVIVTDATSNWTALEVFDFKFFKNIYLNAKNKKQIRKCQFFPYKSGFSSLFEALSIPDERVNFETGTDPWYFGWSNCEPIIGEILRKHYGRPYFLPEKSENNAVDWIFMGGTGLGAHMHVDNVRLPSWQAQLHGSKQWILKPPPECHFQCQSTSVIVSKGDIIVLDTNKWFHQTIVQPGQVSITIGAEYD